MLSHLQRAQRRRRYERASSADDTPSTQAVTPPTTPETPKVEGFHFYSPKKTNSSFDNGTKNNSPKAFHFCRRQMSEPEPLVLDKTKVLAYREKENEAKETKASDIKTTTSK